MRDVLYIVKSKLHFYPPCVSQIRSLKQLGVNVHVVYGSCAQSVVDMLKSEDISCEMLCDPRNTYKNQFLDKAHNWICFRRALSHYLKKHQFAMKNELLWFGNAETFLCMKGALSKYRYATTYLELLDNKPGRMHALKKMAQKAEFNVACEETRAYIMKAWWQLRELPYIMPNKPFADPSENTELTDPKAKALIEKIGISKKIVLYQGILKEYDIMKNILLAVDQLGDEYRLLLMGPDPENIVDRLKHISDKLVYSEYITAPNHLQVTARAYIGVVFYNGDSNLNRAYCAPNKIYEYGAFGLPMLGNKIPGLKHTVEQFHAGVCTEMNSSEILHAIKLIESSYDTMHTGARNLYDATDNEAIMKKIIQEKL